MKKIILIQLLFISVLLQGQNQINGTVINSDDRSVLSFVNIGIKSKNVGTISSDAGVFSILIPDKNLDDTLTFSMIGFKELSIPIDQIISAKLNVFQLKAKATQLQVVDVSAKKLIENKYGIKKENPKIHFIDASVDHNDIFEIAQLIKLNSTLSKLTSVNLLINEANTDSGTFRINFYGFDGNKPTKRLNEINVLETLPVKDGWMKFDLKKYNVYLKGQVVVGIEFIPRKKNRKVSFEVKLGGSSRSFVRSSSLGEWDTPPHHYRMYVTVLEDDIGKREKKDTEEAEMIPSKRFFSENVKDTFSVFINLPKGYDRNSNKKYPLVFILDANVYYDIINTAVHRISQNEKFIEPIVVGIGYRSFIEGDSLRDRDFTYPSALKEDSFIVSGGANRFLAFIEKELIPYVSKNFKTDTTNRTLMGHSLGGYFTLFALLKDEQEQKNVFKNYVSASPSIDYCNRYLFYQFKELSLRQVNPHRKELLLATGSLEDQEDGGGTMFNSFAELLSDERFKSIKVQKIIFSGAAHMGTAVPTFDKGLELIIKK